MKKLITCLALYMIGAAGIAQESVLDKQIAVQFNETSAPEVLEKIADEYDIALVYQPSALAEVAPVTGNYEGNLDNFLNQLFTDAPVSVVESNRQLVLRMKPVEQLPLLPQRNVPSFRVKGFGQQTALLDVPQPDYQTTDFSIHPADTAETGANTYKGYPQRPAHIGIIYPLSTNGVEAGKYVNIVSMHLFAGVSAGVNGITLAGISNYDKHFVDGVQLAGITNITVGKVQGMQWSGIANIAGGGVTGLQAAGIANVARDTVFAGQLAGIANVSAGYVAGGQFAGIANVNTTSSDGVQAAGIVNVTPGDHRGLMAAGIANYSSSIQGAQFAGIANVAHENVEGFQAAGIINVAGKVTGSQLALFNVADSVSGVPIGLLSFVKHGYRRVEIRGSQALHMQVAFKMGVQKFYNILAFGYHFSGADPFEYGNEPTWAYGYGIGSEFNLGQTWRMNIDLTTFDVIEKENTFSNKKLNLLNQFRLNFGAQIGRTTTIVFGPSFNVMVSELSGNDLGSYGSDLPPYTVYDKTHGDTNVKMWPGFNVAIRF